MGKCCRRDKWMRSRGYWPDVFWMHDCPIAQRMADRTMQLLPPRDMHDCLEHRLGPCALDCCAGGHCTRVLVT